MKFKKPKQRNVAKFLPRKAQATTGESRDVLAVAYRMCGTRTETVKLAKQFITLKATRFPDITLPEAVTFVLLESFQEEFEFQKEFNGGKIYRGGSVADFWLPNQQTVFRVQGNWWHSRPDRIAEDEIQRAAMLLGTIDGKHILAVIDIWESRLLSCGRKHIVQAAIQGFELGK